MPQNPLDQPVSVHTLRQWHREGVIDQDTFLRARTMAQPTASWRSWLSLELLVAGVALVLSGIIFFFAYNWQAMGRFEKLGLIELTLLVCIVGALRSGLSTLGGQVLILAATVMTGVFLAVFGQIYQTGADAYELFTGWAALTLIWVMIARLESLWCLWLAILQTGIVLFWMQVAEPGWDWPFDAMCIGLGAVNAAALIIRECVKPMAHYQWFRVTLLLAMLTSFIIPALYVIFDGLDDELLRLAHIPIWLLVTGTSYWFFRFVRSDFACVAVTLANLTVWVASLLGRGLFAVSHFGDGMGLFLLMSLIIVAASAGLTFWLAHEYQAMRKRSS